MALFPNSALSRVHDMPYLGTSTEATDGKQYHECPLVNIILIGFKWLPIWSPNAGTTSLLAKLLWDIFHLNQVAMGSYMGTTVIILIIPSLPVIFISAQSFTWDMLIVLYCHLLIVESTESIYSCTFSYLNWVLFSWIVWATHQAAIGLFWDVSYVILLREVSVRWQWAGVWERTVFLTIPTWPVTQISAQYFTWDTDCTVHSFSTIHAHIIDGNSHHS